MAETIDEFKDEVRAIRTELAEKGEAADVKLVASWLDRLLLSLEKIAPTLDIMAVELEELNNAVDALTAKKAKVVKKKPGKKKKAKKRK